MVQYEKRKEAERLLEEDQRRLRKEMNAKRAREEAEKLHEVVAHLWYFYIAIITSVLIYVKSTSRDSTSNFNYINDVLYIKSSN